MSRLTRRRDVIPLIALFSAAAVSLTLGGRPIADESYHLGQIRHFYGESSPVLPMFPGYHYLMSLLGSAFHRPSLDFYRAVNLIFAFGSAAVFFLCARELDTRYAPIRTLGYFFLPVVFPYMFLLYTEPLSHLLLFAMILHYLRGRIARAGLFGFMSLLVRQSNVVWVGMVFLMAYMERAGTGHSWRQVGRYLRGGWTFLLAFAFFLGFIIYNGGLVSRYSLAGATHMLTGAFPLHAGNLFFSMLSLWFLFPALMVSALPGVLRVQFRRSWVIACLVAGFAFYLAAFRVSHPWNSDPWYLGNRVLRLASGSLLLKAVLFVPAAAAVAVLARLELHRRSMRLLYPFWVLSLLPFWLISLRYESPPLVMLLLFMRPLDRRVEWASLIFFMVSDAVIFPGITRGRFFP